MPALTDTEATLRAMLTTKIAAADQASGLPPAIRDGWPAIVLDTGTARLLKDALDRLEALP
jgi:hypothetical protein